MHDVKFWRIRVPGMDLSSPPGVRLRCTRWRTKHSLIVTLSSRPGKTSVCTDTYMPLLVFDMTGKGTSSTDYTDIENHVYDSSLWHPNIV